MLTLPNIPNPTVPQGMTDEDNVEIRKFGEPTKFDFEPKAHWDLGADLGILDPETAAKISGSRFTVYRDLGAKLERAIVKSFSLILILQSMDIQKYSHHLWLAVKV